MYRVAHLVANLGWVDLNFDYSTVCLIPAWADGSLSEAAGQLGKTVELPNPSQPNPGSRPDGPPCTYEKEYLLPDSVFPLFLFRVMRNIISSTAPHVTDVIKSSQRYHM